MTNERSLIESGKIGTQEIMTNPIHTMMIKLEKLNMDFGFIEKNPFI